MVSAPPKVAAFALIIRQWLGRPGLSQQTPALGYLFTLCHDGGPKIWQHPGLRWNRFQAGWYAASGQNEFPIGSAGEQAQAAVRVSDVPSAGLGFAVPLGTPDFDLERSGANFHVSHLQFRDRVSETWGL